MSVANSGNALLVLIVMRWTEEPRTKLHASYEAAFGQLRKATRQLQSLAQDPGAGEPERETARRRVAEAFRAYRASRDRLAESLLASRHEENRLMTDFRDELQYTAYHLWEQAGRPSGKPDEHWYQAEQLLRSRL
jgi:hypothetical protein